MSDVTVGQLLDAIGGGADLGYFDGYTIGGQDVRNASIGFPTYFRSVSLISSVMAQMLSGGSLSIRNRDGEVVETDRARRILDLFEHSPDGMTASHTWIEDWVTDYLVEGNALCEVVRGYRNGIMGLHRLSSWDANTVIASNGMTVYRARKIGGAPINEYREIAEMNVVHSRWGRMLRYAASQSVNRWNFAAAPVRLMRPALEIGLAGDRYIKEWFDGINSSIGISFEDRLRPEQFKEVQAQIDSTTSSSRRRKPLVVGSKAMFTNLQNNAASKDQAMLREFQVSDIARIYGIPGPIIGQNVTQWGQGIEALAKFFWKFCIRQHIDRMLAPVKFQLLLPGQRFEVDPTELLRGDIADIATLITAVSGDAQRDQIATTEEMRNWMGLPVEPEKGELRMAQQDDKSEPDSNGMNGNES